MAPPKPELPRGDRTNPQGPLGQLLHDLIAGMSYERAADTVNKAAIALDKHEHWFVPPNYTRTTFRNWIGRWVVPRPEALRWIAYAFDADASALALAAEQQGTEKARLRNQYAQAAAVPTLPSVDPKTSAIQRKDYVAHHILSSHPNDNGSYNQGSSDWPTWFGLRLAHLISVVDRWQGELFSSDGLQSLLHQEILMFDALEPADSQEAISFSLSRRQTLAALASLPVALTTSSVGSFRAAVATEVFLARCAASLTACWHLLKGAELSAVEQLLSSYLVSLAAMAQNTSAHRQAAARLASQAHRICGIVALHRQELRVRERHCQQALYFANIADDASIKVSALVSLASTHFYGNDPRRATAVYEQALSLSSGAPILQRSRIHAELAVVYGQMQREHDALQSLAAAQDLYPEQPEQDRSFLYAEFTPASMALEQGLAYLALAEHYPGKGYQRRAQQVFDHVEQSMAHSMPDRIKAEITNHHATAAILLDDLELFENYFIDGLADARKLRSKQRHQESLLAWRRANKTWPGERRLKLVADQLELPSATEDQA